MPDDSGSPLPLTAKLRLAARIWRGFLAVSFRNPRQPLPQFIATLGRARTPAAERLAPRRLRGAVLRVLRIGPWRPTCLANALVLYRLLWEQGDPAELVIGLPLVALDHRAHAWVELHGEDLGPFPGKRNHSALARFGPSTGGTSLEKPIEG